MAMHIIITINNIQKNIWYILNNLISLQLFIIIIIFVNLTPIWLGHTIVAQLHWVVNINLATHDTDSLGLVAEGFGEGADCLRPKVLKYIFKLLMLLTKASKWLIVHNFAH